MKHIIAYSGGLQSFEVARLVVAEYGPQDVECVFTDTLTEDEDLYRFLQDTVAYLGCAFIHLSDGRGIWDVFRSVRFMGNSRVDPCSRILKRELFAKYLQGQPKDSLIYYGIGRHEAHRFGTLVERWSPMGFQLRAPLLSTGTTKEEILVTLDQLGIRPPRLYDLGFEHNNCGGFCVKTGQRQMAHLLKVLPERYAWHEHQQEALAQEIGMHGFIRQTVSGELRYLSLKEFREQVEAGQQVQKFEDGACACFS